MELKLECWWSCRLFGFLLIVLNGIETNLIISVWKLFRFLLIVLNGIETISIFSSLVNPNSFNRTKWNWNCIKRSRYDCIFWPFNRTKWNWNDMFNYVFADTDILLIVLNGIETTWQVLHRRREDLLIVLNGIETKIIIFALSNNKLF